MPTRIVAMPTPSVKMADSTPAHRIPIIATVCSPAELVRALLVGVRGGAPAVPRLYRATRGLRAGGQFCRCSACAALV